MCEEGTTQEIIKTCLIYLLPFPLTHNARVILKYPPERQLPPSQICRLHNIMQIST